MPFVLWFNKWNFCSIRFSHVNTTYLAPVEMWYYDLPPHRAWRDLVGLMSHGHLIPNMTCTEMASPLFLTKPQHWWVKSVSKVCNIKQTSQDNVQQCDNSKKLDSPSYLWPWILNSNRICVHTCDIIIQTSLPSLLIENTNITHYILDNTYLYPTKMLNTYWTWLFLWHYFVVRGLPLGSWCQCWCRQGHSASSNPWIPRSWTDPLAAATALRRIDTPHILRGYKYTPALK